MKQLSARLVWLVIVVVTVLTNAACNLLLRPAPTQAQQRHRSQAALPADHPIP